MTILVTGFEPFGGEPVNPSWEGARPLDGWAWRGQSVVARLIPCAYEAALAHLRAAMRELKPSIIIGMGQAAGREGLSIERVAVNLDDTPQPDNEGEVRRGVRVMENAPPAYLSDLPIAAILDALRAAGIPAAESLSAGAFVCNHFFFAACHARARSRRSIRVGFIHVPLSTDQAPRHPGAPTMPIESMTEGLRIVIRTTVEAAQA
jgi:pyroglutamyl-peptidase